MLLLAANPSIPEPDEYKHNKYHELQAAESSCMWPSSTPRKPANQWALKLSPQFDASTGTWKLQRSKWDNKFLWYWITKLLLLCQPHLPALNVLYLYWRISLHNLSSELPHSALDYLPTFFQDELNVAYLLKILWLKDKETSLGSIIYSWHIGEESTYKPR